MAYGKLLMEKPGGEEQKKIPLGFSWLMLFFGPLVPLFRGQMLHFFLAIALIIPTLSVSWWTYPLFINFFWRRKLMSKGFNPVDVEGVSYDEVVRRTGIDIYEPPSFKHDDDRVFPRWLLFWALQLVPISIFSAVAFQEEISALLDGQSPNSKGVTELDVSSYRYWKALIENDPEQFAERLSTFELARKDVLDTNYDEIARLNDILFSAHSAGYDYFLKKTEADPEDADANEQGLYHQQRKAEYELEKQADRYCVGVKAKQDAYTQLTRHIEKNLFEEDKLARQIAGDSYRFRFLTFPDLEDIDISIDRSACRFDIESQYITEQQVGAGSEYERIGYQAEVVRGHLINDSQIADDPWKVWRISIQETSVEKSSDGILWE